MDTLKTYTHLHTKPDTNMLKIYRLFLSAPPKEVPIILILFTHIIAYYSHIVLFHECFRYILTTGEIRIWYSMYWFVVDVLYKYKWYK